MMRYYGFGRHSARFISEKSLMKLHEYPGYPDHKEKHEKMTGHVLALKRKFERGEVSSPIQITSFLKDWVAKHIAGTVRIGIVVDSVSEVLNIKAGEIEEAPAFGARLDTDFILGMAKTEGGVKILLAIDRVLSTQEVSVLEKAA